MSEDVHEGLGPTDAELVARVLARGDANAFAQIVRRHQSPVRSLLRRLACGDASLADDLAQETFLRAYRGLARYRGTAKLSTWLHRIAWNVFLDERARRGPEPAGDEEPEAEEDGADGPPPDAALLAHDLERAMSALSPAERAALALSYRQGASHAEVAEILDLPLGTVKTHIARGRRKLERRLRAWAP